jgi:RNA polymerase primary sigma factor
MIRALKIKKAITNRSSLSLNHYLSEISRADRITPEEEVELALKIKEGGTEGNMALEKLVKANLLFVISVANQYSNPSIPFEDLVQEGNIGLIHAAETFEPTYGNKFISYAVWHIRQRILRALSELGRTVHIPLNGETFLNSIAKATSLYEQRYGFKPSEAEIADLLNVSESKVKTVLRASRRDTSINAPVPGTEDLTIGDMLSSDSFFEADFNIDSSSLGMELNAVLKGVINEQTAEFIRMHFGIGYPFEMDYKDIGEAYGLSSESVRQRVVKAITKLKRSANIDILRKYIA